MADARYHIVPRVSEESDRDSSPREQLLPSPNMNTRYRTGSSGPWKVDFDPVLWLRIVSTIVTLVSFILLVIDGGEKFIATDIFLMMIIISNVLQIINHLVTHLFKVTVELRRQTRSVSLGANVQPRISMYFDVGLSICLLISLSIGVSIMNRRWWHNGASTAGSILGWIVLGLQPVLSLPQLANKSLLLTAKLSDLRETHTPDTKYSPTPSMGDATNIERAPAGRQREPRPTAEDLV